MTQHPIPGSLRLPDQPLAPERLRVKPLASGVEPTRIVMIRLQALGDCVLTLPALAALKDRWPRCRLDVITGVTAAPVFSAWRDVERVFTFDSRASRRDRLLGAAELIRGSRAPRPDVVLDLQRSRWSRLFTLLLRPRASVAFDRFAPETALTRYRDAIERVGLGRLPLVLEPRLKADVVGRARDLLTGVGRDTARPLVCLNPAGGWVTKQWPLERYVELGRRLRKELGAQLLGVGEGAALPRLAALKRELGDALLDLSGRTTPAEAMGLVATASLVVSDDSGLLHMAWTQGVPSLAVFGSSRSTWSRPEGPRSAGFYSEDLACGACLQPVCARGDLLCLERVDVDSVFGRCVSMMARRGTLDGPLGH